MFANNGERQPQRDLTLSVAYQQMKAKKENDVLIN